VAPEPPKGVVAFPSAAGIRVVWEGVEGRDVVGYRVFRAAGPDGPWELLTSEPIPTVLFVDSKVEKGRWYWYAVTALDNAVPPNESRKSEPARVRLTAGEAQESSPAKPAR
jgi:fibronectin type 3 domain-containing protein